MLLFYLNAVIKIAVSHREINNIPEEIIVIYLVQNVI